LVDLPLSLITYPYHSLVYLLIVEGEGLVTSCLSLSLSPLSLSRAERVKAAKTEGAIAPRGSPPTLIYYLEAPPNIYPPLPIEKAKLERLHRLL
jgi:hypothetical protein